MEITDRDEIEELLYGYEYTRVTEETVVGTSRWYNYVEQVLQHKNSGKYYKAEWKVGLTEYQGVDMVLTLTEVEPYVVETTKYREVH